MASIVATIGAMGDEGVVENAASIGADVLGPGLAELADRHEVVGEVRGLGVFWAVELVADRGTREPVDASVMARLRTELLERGILPFVAENRLHVVPPCVITPDEARRGVAAIDEALAVVGAGA